MGKRANSQTQIREGIRVVEISGEISPNLEIAPKITKIDGEIPPIEFRNMKMGNFSLLSRKISAYLPRIEPHSLV